MVKYKCIIIVLVATLGSVTAGANSDVYDITDYGAIADGQSDCSAAISEAIVLPGG